MSEKKEKTAVALFARAPFDRGSFPEASTADVRFYYRNHPAKDGDINKKQQRAVSGDPH